MGPLSGVRVIELAGYGPGPFAGMLLADLGADVLLIERSGPDRLGIPKERRFDLTHRNKRSVCLDLKTRQGVAAVMKLISRADALIEGFRPGVVEKLGIGPDEALGRNRRLIYG